MVNHKEPVISGKGPMRAEACSLSPCLAMVEAAGYCLLRGSQCVGQLLCIDEDDSQFGELWNENRASAGVSKIRSCSKAHRRQLKETLQMDHEQPGQAQTSGGKSSRYLALRSKGRD
ncbi:MAG TPA: hypothetical protein VGF67_21335 [Ktedonobacteraceae bacterium]|jgi:hypothetical protein